MNSSKHEETAKIYLAMTNVPSVDWSVVVNERPQVIGRGRTADILIPSTYGRVSRRHAVIWQDRRGTQICDLGSKSGTHVNGVWIERDSTVRLRPRDRLWLGGVELEIVEEIAALAQPVAERAFFTGNEDDASVSTPSLLSQAALEARLRMVALTPAEREVVLWLTRGHIDDKSIGKILHRSPHTVRTQIGNVLRKLNLTSRAEIVGWLRRGGRPTAAKK